MGAERASLSLKLSSISLAPLEVLSFRPQAAPAPPLLTHIDAVLPSPPNQLMNTAGLGPVAFRHNGKGMEEKVQGWVRGGEGRRGKQPKGLWGQQVTPDPSGGQWDSPDIQGTQWPKGRCLCLLCVLVLSLYLYLLCGDWWVQMSHRNPHLSSGMTASSLLG